jgi:hypothetical protein
MGLIVPEYSFKGTTLTNVYISIHATCSLIREPQYENVGTEEEPELIEVQMSYFITATCYHYLNQGSLLKLFSERLKIPYTEQPNIYLAIYDYIKTQFPTAIDE